MDLVVFRGAGRYHEKVVLFPRKTLPFYSTSGQVLEEQGNSSGNYTQRYVWSPNYINEMIDRDTSTSGSLTATGSSLTRTWAVNDANYNVIAILQVSDSVASVVERYEYDPFGTRTVLSAGYATEGGSSYGWVYGFQGMRLDGVTGNSLSLTRDEDPTTGAWSTKDPKGFSAGDNDFYRVEGNGPVDGLDPSGEVLANIIAGVGGLVIGAGIGYWSTGTWQGAVAGGVAGGLTGASLGLAGPGLATYYGGGAVGVALAGGTCAAMGDLAGQATYNGLTGQQGWNPTQTAVAFGSGFVMVGGVYQYTGITPWPVYRPPFYATPGRLANPPTGLTVLSGDGYYITGEPPTTCPPGTFLSTFCDVGDGLPDSVGGLLDAGIPPPSSGTYYPRTYGPGDLMPRFYLTPPGSQVTIMGGAPNVVTPSNPVLIGGTNIVATTTPLERLLQPNMGQVWWSACATEYNFPPFEVP
jgi:hypothetical protein